MNLNKEFINELGKRRKSTAGEVILAIGMVEVSGNKLVNLNNNLEKLEQVFYTIDYLEENNFLRTESRYVKSRVPDFNPRDFINDTSRIGYRGSRMHAMAEYLESYWGKELLVRPAYFRMIENGYKTDEKLKENKNMWLALGAAFLASFLTALFTEFFPRVF